MVGGSSGEEKGVWSLTMPTEEETHLLWDIMGVIRVIS